MEIGDSVNWLVWEICEKDVISGQVGVIIHMQIAYAPLAYLVLPFPRKD